MRLVLAFTAASLLAATTVEAAEPLGRTERVSVRLLSVVRGPETTSVNYALTSREPHPIDYVRVACDLVAGRGSVIDQGVGIEEDLGGGETVQGSVDFNNDEALRGRRFRCRVAAAYRTR